MGQVISIRRARGGEGGHLSEATVSGSELAAELGVTERTLYNWRRRGMPWEAYGLRHIRYYPSRVRAWLNEQARSTRIVS